MQMRRSELWTVVPTIVLILSATGISLRAAQTEPQAAVALEIGGEVAHPMRLTLDDISKMPHVTVKAFNGHDKKDETYEGVSLRELLTQAGLPVGEALRGKNVSKYVEMEASDGYKVVFALAELDPSFQDSKIIVADKLNGAPLPKDQGPLKLVAPLDKRPGRWIRMLKTVTVRQAP